MEVSENRETDESEGIRTDGNGSAHRQRNAQNPRPSAIEVKREAGLPAITIDRQMTIPEMRDAGLTIDQIAEVTGKDRVTVFQEL